jgi:hypothetical protein
MINDQREYSVAKGFLYLKAIKNPVTKNDTRSYLTGGVNSRNKFFFLYGKVEIHMKKECAQGAWPGLWMIPEESAYGGWPHSGEIDIMEHLNFDNNIHYNVHTRYVAKNRSEPQRSQSPPPLKLRRLNYAQSALSIQSISCAPGTFIFPFLQCLFVIL